MFEAQYLFKDNLVFSPWMERQGDLVQISGELVDATVAGAETTRVRVQVFTKNREEPGPGTQVGGNLFLQYVGKSDWMEYSDLKELVRYRFRCNNGNGAASPDDHALFRMFKPLWFDEVEA